MSVAALRELALRAKSIGYAATVTPDHLGIALGPIATLATVAAATTHLRIGTFVLNNDLRHPMVLAQELATLDLLSEGRLEIAIGAGWNRPEYLRAIAAGIRSTPRPRGSPDSKSRWPSSKASSATAHSAIAVRTTRSPRQTVSQSPFSGHIPRSLSAAADAGRFRWRAARQTSVGLAPRTQPGSTLVDPRSLTVEAAAEKLEWVREAAGDRYDRLEINAYPSQFSSLVTDRARAEATDRAAAITARSGIAISADELLASPHQYIGTVGSLCDKLVELRQRLGISSFMLGDVDEMAPVVERLAGT